MPPSKYYSVLIVPDGVENPIGLKMRAWMFKTLVALFIATIIGMIFFFSFYGKILVRASQASQLREENEDLKRFKYKLALLEENMKETRKLVSQISALAGIDFTVPELPPDSEIFAEMAKPAEVEKEVVAQVSDDGSPRGLPIKGYVTRGFSDDPDHYHPGIDIAGEIGAAILATGAGIVAETGFDSVYGQVVVIKHENGLSTLYGHNSEILVEVGQEVLIGSRIALLGNSGRSTAPHVHYELRKDDQPVNPITYRAEDEIHSDQK